MPELPEVETVVRGLAAALGGRRLDRVVARRPDLRWPLPADLGQRLGGATVTGLGRRGKYGLMRTDRGDSLVFHLGMSGCFRPLAGDPGRHDHVLFEADGLRLAFHDPRRFGMLDLVPTAAEADHPLLAGMGPEPLADGFGGAALAAAAAGRRVAVKPFLMDQRAVAGVGNIYAAEALWLAGIHPGRAVGAIARARLDRLATALRQVLGDAIAAGGSTLRDHAQVSGALGYFQQRLAVYGRAGQPCPRCAAPVRRRLDCGRSTFWCAGCQR